MGEVFYRIAEVSTAKASGHTYVLVDFWPSRAAFERGDAPVLTNDFLMQLRPTGQRIITRADGWLELLDSSYADPSAETTLEIASDQFKRETVYRNIPTEIRANIEAYWKRAQARGDTGNKVDPRIQRDESDPHGVLARPGVKALRGVGVELP